MRKPLRRGLVAAGLLIGAWLQPVSAAAAPDDLAEVRAATAAYHRLDVVQAAGYGELVDRDGIACISDPAGQGAMGIHHVNSALVGDGTADANQPEVLIYEPTSSGRLRLVGVEYVVFQEQWQEANPGTVPSLFGQEYELIGAGNRYGLPPFYALHVWVWKDNPSGMFEGWNPRVSC